MTADHSQEDVAVLKWDKSLETGIMVTDEQHRALFKQVNTLFDDRKSGRVPETLAFIEEYVMMHFGTEEMMQKISKYPKAAAHKEMHENFAVAFAGLKKEYEESDADDMLILMKITKELVDWLNNHVKGADKEFGEYFKASGFDQLAGADD